MEANTLSERRVPQGSALPVLASPVSSDPPAQPHRACGDRFSNARVAARLRASHGRGSRMAPLLAFRARITSCYSHRVETAFYISYQDYHMVGRTSDVVRHIFRADGRRYYPYQTADVRTWVDPLPDGGAFPAALMSTAAAPAGLPPLPRRRHRVATPLTPVPDGGAFDRSGANCCL